jgi:hypothetical protein
LFKNREEAELRSRVVIDQDRVSKMNKGSFWKKKFLIC